MVAAVRCNLDESAENTGQIDVNFGCLFDVIYDALSVFFQNDFSFYGFFEYIRHDEGDGLFRSFDGFFCYVLNGFVCHISPLSLSCMVLKLVIRLSKSGRKLRLCLIWNNR